MRIDEDLYALAAKLGRAALARRVSVATAESCTGGLVAGAITAIAGSSDWFDRGFVTYSDRAKIEDLGVPEATLERWGAVSEPTALAMARGACLRSHAQWAVAITGIAGAAGGTMEKQVGTVCFALTGPEGMQSTTCRLNGDRAGIRRESVRIALEGLVERLEA